MADENQLRDKYLSCSICFETFTEPKTLPCLHTFCAQCLDNYILNLDQPDIKRGFSCPYCREHVSPPNPNRPPSDWAAQFKTNFHLKDLIEHLSEVHPGTDSSNRCPQHPSKELDIYCTDHSKLICHLCAGIAHRACKDVMAASEAADIMRTDFQTLINCLQSQELVIKRAMQVIQKERETLANKKYLMEEKVRDATSNIIVLIKKHEDRLLLDLNTSWKSIDGKIGAKLKAITTDLSEKLTSMFTALDVISSATDAEIIIGSIVDFSIKPMDTVKVNALLKDIQTIDIKFQLFTKMISQLRGEFGTIQFCRKEVSTDAVKPNTTRDRQVKPKPLVRPRSKTVSAGPVPKPPAIPSLVRTIKGQMREDKNPAKFKDITVLPITGIIVVSDWNNSCVKAFLSRRDKDLRLTLGGKPWGVSALDTAQVVVSVPLSRQICVVRVTPTIMLMSSVMSQKQYSGLTVVNKDTIVATGGNDPPGVDIINISGEVLKSFSMDPGGSPLFAYPAYVCVNSQNTIIVSDKLQCSVTGLDPRTGQVTFCFKPDGRMSLREPQGVFCTQSGNIYLVETRGVIELSSDGLFQRPLLKLESGLEDPTSICMSDTELIYIVDREGEIAIFRNY